MTANAKLNDLLARMERITKYEHARRDQGLLNCDLGTVTLGDVSDLCEAVRRLRSDVASARAAQIARGDVFADTNPEAQWIEDMKNACPSCGGSGHKDDTKPCDDLAIPEVGA